MRKIRVLDNVYDLITINMEDRFKDNVAFRFYDTANDAVTTILYKDYVQDIRKAVNYFQSTIPEIKGKKICLLTKNSYEYAVNTFGVVAAGAVLVLLNQRKSWDELPKEAKAYVEFLEKQLGHEIQFVSTGAEREKFVLKGAWL